VHREGKRNGEDANGTGKRRLDRFERAKHTGNNDNRQHTENDIDQRNRQPKSRHELRFHTFQQTRNADTKHHDDKKQKP
jgi:hypothetical protein